MNKMNYVDETFLLLERPNIREECNINSEEEMNKYLIAYNTYNELLIKFLIKKFDLKAIDMELEKKEQSFPAISDADKDLYQHSAEGYLKYFYLRNNIYIERLNQGQLQYLLSVYSSNNFELSSENEQFINNTYLNVILESPSEKSINISYGPDNLKYYKPSNSIVIGVRYDKFKNSMNNDQTLNNFVSLEGQLLLLTQFLEYKIKRQYNIPFSVIEYDDFSVHRKKKMIDISRK